MPLGAARAYWTASVQCPLSDGWDWTAPSPSSLKFLPSISAPPQILPRNILGLGYLILKDHPTPAPARPGTSQGCSEQNSPESLTAPGRPSLLLRGQLRAADGEGSAAGLRGVGPAPPDWGEPGTVSRTQQGGHTLETFRLKERPAPQGGCPLGAPVCPPQGLHKFLKKRNVFSRVSCCPPL